MKMLNRAIEKALAAGVWHVRWNQGSRDGLVAVRRVGGPHRGRRLQVKTMGEEFPLGGEMFAFLKGLARDPWPGEEETPFLIDDEEERVRKIRWVTDPRFLISETRSEI